VSDPFDEINRQIRQDHSEIRERNAKREAVWRQSPAMRLASNLLQGPFGHEPVGEEEHGVMLLRTREAMLREPLVQRYLNYLEYSPKPHSNTEWWHALGHQYIVIHGLTKARSYADVVAHPAQEGELVTLLDPRLFQDDTHEGALKDIGPHEFSYEWIGRVMRAKTYLWHQNTYDAATAAPLVPHVVQPNALPFDDLFFSFENAAFLMSRHTTSNFTEAGEEVTATSETWWMHISRLGPAGFALVFDRYLIPDDEQWLPQHHIMFEVIPYGSRWPEDFEDRDSYNVIGTVLRMLAFMQAPFVDANPSPRELPRDIRKDYKRALKEPPLKEVSIVTLRRKLNEPIWRPGDAEPNGSGRVYRNSWWVSGHYRWQWFPSEQTHRLIAIDQYIKQRGKPMLPRLYDVSQ